MYFLEKKKQTLLTSKASATSSGGIAGQSQGKILSLSFCKYLQQRRMIQLNFFYVFLFKDSLALSSSYIATGRLLFGGLTLSIGTSTYIYLNVFFIDLDAHKNSGKQLCSRRYNAFTTLEQATTYQYISDILVA